MAEAELTGRDIDEALAMALGYEYVDAPARLNEVGVLGKLWHSPDGKWRLDGLPVFHRSLNDMHTVESEIERRGLVDDYVRELVQIAAAGKSILSDLRWLTIHATAAQKARAALVVLTGAKESK